MEKWYVMRTVPGKEREAGALMERTIDKSLWSHWRVLKKQKLFRAKGKLFLSMETMFPGYIFVKSSLPKELEEELNKSREYPKLIGNEAIETVPVEEQDLKFLQAVCGNELEKPMSLSRVEADEEGKLIHVDGILKKYEGQIIRQRLRKRYVLAEVELFQRKENVLFGVYLPGDEIWQERRVIEAVITEE